MTIGLVVLVTFRETLKAEADGGGIKFAGPCGLVIMILGFGALIFPFTPFYRDSGQSEPIAVVPAPASTTSPPRPEIQFDSPLPNAEVTKDGFQVSGTSSGLAPTDKLWLVTLATPRLGGDNYLPQDAPCTLYPAGKFSCKPYYVGSAEDGEARRMFEAIILRVTNEAANKFLEYHETPESKEYKGLSALPSGADPIDSIKVQRGLP